MVQTAREQQGPLEAQTDESIEVLGVTNTSGFVSAGPAAVPTVHPRPGHPRSGGSGLLRRSRPGTATLRRSHLTRTRPADARPAYTLGSTRVAFPIR